MQSVWCIQKMYPTATLNDFEVVIDVQGNWTITKWLLADPKPLNTDIENYWAAHSLDYSKEKKIEQLEQQCDAAIMGGFTSNALGQAHQYQSMLIDEVWFNSTIHRFNIDPNFTAVNYKTIDAGYLPHSKAQFFQVFIDGHTWGDEQIIKLEQLKNQVTAATDEPTLDSITW